MKKVSPEELEKFRYKMIKKLIRRKTFNGERFLNKHWVVVVDGTQLFSFKERHCEHCLTRKCIDEETGEEQVRYYHQVLEAKIVFCEDIVLSLGTEFIENAHEQVSKKARQLSLIFPYNNLTYTNLYLNPFWALYCLGIW